MIQLLFVSLCVCVLRLDSVVRETYSGDYLLLIRLFCGSALLLMEKT